METVRRYVFPVIWMVILGLIAAALVKMAFFGDPARAGSGDEITPEAAIDKYATVAVTRGDIASTLPLDAKVTPDPAAPQRAAVDGEITTLHVRDGDHVQQGDPILETRREDTSAGGGTGGDSGSGDGTDGGAPAAPRYRYSVLRADRDGIIQGLTSMKGQTVAVGDTLASVSPGTYAIVADLTPEQQLQMLDVDLHASAALPTAADPVPCEAPSIVEDDPSDADRQQTPTQTDPMGVDPAAGPMAGDGSGTGTEQSAATLRCPVPAGTRIVPGLDVKVTVDLGTANGVLVLPTTAVTGRLSQGSVYVLDEKTGEPVAKPVTLGKRSQDQVEITGGLAEGDEVLQFVPGAPADQAEQEQTW